MTAFIIILSVILLGVVIVQIGRINDLAAKFRGREEAEQRSSDSQAFWFLIIGIIFLILCVASALYYVPWMLGYGPHQSASAHGGTLDSIFNVTLFFTGVVFVLTHIALFWFTYKYRQGRGRKASFIPHNNTLEWVWMGIPAIVMTFLVIKGLVAWNEVMTDVGPEEEVINIGATGWQFAWNLRYPGEDGELGAKNFQLIKPGVNELGQDWTDPRNHDDFMADELVLPVGKKVRVAISARDVIHNFYLPHFRVKMDAVPGIPTYFIFTPSKTTEEYRRELKKYPEYNVPSDPEDPNSPPLWKTFNYELACAELCGIGHYSMRRLVKVVSQGEYEAWLSGQKSHYLTKVHNTDDDPLKGQIVPAEMAYRTKEFKDKLATAISATVPADRVVLLDYVFFKTGSAELDMKSKFELDNVAAEIKSRPELQVELAGHTDNTGNPDSNLELSKARAQSVLSYLLNAGVSESQLTSDGYGQNEPIEDNATPEGRAANRRTELRIL